jgi:hypothetical protein
MNVAGPEMRNVTVLLNVQDAKKLPQTGAYLSKFLTNLTQEHGLFTVSIVVSVEPAESTAFGAAEMPRTDIDGDVDIVFITEN